MTNQEYNSILAMQKQKELCEKKGYPHFAPRSGRCYRCNKNIYEPIEHERKNLKTGEITGKYVTGITVEKASISLVTGCPHCNRSYCD